MRIKTTIKYLLLHILYFFVGFVPRNRKIWIFGSKGESFFGNSKWLFLHPKKNIRKIWISRSKKIVKLVKAKGFEAYYLKSLKGLYCAVRGGIYIFNVHTHYDINYFLSRGTKKVNLWHGVGVKKIGLDSDLTNNYFYKVYRGSLKQKLHYRFFCPWEYEKYDMMICISEMTKKCMETAFGKRAKNVVITGYPCNDVLLKKSKQKKPDSQKKIILYMPTYRDAKVSKTESINIPIDWKRLNSFLAKNNSIFVLKLHPVEKSALQILPIYKNIRVLNSLTDVYPILKCVDILITDYSTICYDFLLLNRPIIFFWYDYKEYTTKNRSLYPEFENLSLGLRVKTLGALLKALGKCMYNKNNFNDCQRIAHKYIDSNSSKRVYEKIISKFVKNQ